jgi:immunity protein, SdpI family
MSRPYWITAILLTLSAWALSAWLYPGLPQRVPTHWNIEGKVDGWGDKSWATFLMPGAMVLMLVLFAFLPALSPRHFEVDSFRSTYLYIMVLVTALFGYMNGVILLATWQEVRGGEKFMDIGRVLIGGMFLFFALLGNVMGKVRKNFYIGIRVPWTLASDRVWNDTHRLAAWLMVAGGIIGFVLVLAGLNLVWAFGVMIVTFLIPVVYSFVHYKALERQEAL